MTNSFSNDQLELLLPVLQQVAELVQKYGRLDSEELQLLLKGGGLDKEDWAVGKLELWADVLTGVCSVTDTSKHNIAIRSLRLGNVPEADARLAIEMAATPSESESAGTCVGNSSLVAWRLVVPRSRRSAGCLPFLWQSR